MTAENNDIAENNKTRRRRAEAWLNRARLQQKEGNDKDSSLCEEFIFLWIAFNALYAPPPVPSPGRSGKFRIFENKSPKNPESPDDIPDWKAMDNFFYHIENQCGEKNLHAFRDALKGDIPAVAQLMELPTAYKRFWDAGFERGKNRKSWEKFRMDDNRKFQNHLDGGKIGKALGLVFARLYVVRNQVFHGAHTIGSQSHGKEQVKMSVLILREVLPKFIEIVKDSPIDWGTVSYPRVSDSPDYEPPIYPQRKEKA